MGVALLEAKDVKKHYPVTSGIVLTKVNGWIKAVDGVKFAIQEGESLGLVGESGCGKTTTARLLLAIEKPTDGQVLFAGRDVHRLTAHEFKAYRASVQAVFQNPYGSLNPRMRIGDFISEPLLIQRGLSRQERGALVAHLLAQVGLPDSSSSLYPHEFSGGQRQRIAVARALALNPRLIILDEPVSAMDVSVQAQLLNLLSDLRTRLGLSYLLIAHNLAVVEHMTSHVCVMYLGKIVERARTEDLFAHPLHPYSVALLAAALPMDPDARNHEVPLKGEVPSPFDPPAGCRFHPRCCHAVPVCSEVEPSFREVTSEHWVACHRV